MSEAKSQNMKLYKSANFLIWPAKFVFFLAITQSTVARTKVALVLTHPDLCKTQFCLHGIHASKSNVLLLAANDERTCRAKIGPHFKALYMSGNFDATEITGTNKCKIEKENAFLAVFDRTNVRHQILTPKILDEDGLESDDKKLKKDSIFVKAWKKDTFHPGGDKTRVAYTKADYRRLKSEAFEYKTKKGILKIYRQIFEDGSNKGVIFAKYNGSWSIVSSGFSIEMPVVFTIDKRIFIWNKTSCQMPCGLIENEIYEFNGSKFKQIYINSDMSH
jgi:hypothetical protein